MDEDLEDYQTSELYISIIMTPVRYPRCFGGNTNVYKIIYRNAMDNNTVANALGQFLAWSKINTLYITGTTESHGEPFFHDLRVALQEEHEIKFFQSIEEAQRSTAAKKVVRIRSLIRGFPTLTSNHRALEFRNRNYQRYRHFNREDFATYIYCGNSENGPLHQFECRSSDGVLCIRRRYTGVKACKVCFWVGRKMRLNAVTEFDPTELDEIDEGIIAEPLGIPEDIYSRHIDEETDVATMYSSDTYDSDCDY